jgi:IS5 family transposase
MKPESTLNSYNLSFPRKSLEGIIDKNHSLFQLADKIDWERLEKRFHKYYVDTRRAPWSKHKIDARSTLASLYL